MALSLSPAITFAEVAAPKEEISKARELVMDAESVIAEAEKSKAKADEAVALSMETIEKAQVVLEKAEISLAENDETIVLLKDNIKDLQSLQNIDKDYIEEQEIWIVASFIFTMLFSFCFTLQSILAKSQHFKLNLLVKRVLVFLLVFVCFFSLVNFSMRVCYQETYKVKETEILNKHIANEQK